MTDVHSGAEVFARAALWFAKRGVQVFPCATSKAPMTSRGFHDATTCRQTIREWAATLEDPQVGIACAASGLVVVDIDDHDAWEKHLLANG